MNPWTALNFPSTATAATVSVAAPTGASASNLCTRLRALQISVSCGATAQTPLQWVVRDGATGAGTIIATGTLAAPANDWAECNLTGLDLRTTPGNALTVEFTAAGVTASQEAVSAQGDYVPQGYPQFLT